MNNIHKTREQLQEEAKELTALIQPETVPIGNINPGRFERMAYHLERFGFADHKRDIDDFIYDPVPKIQQATFQAAMGIALLVLLAVILIAAWFGKTNHRLKQEIALRQQTQRSLEASRQHFKRIVENLQEVYYRTDLQGRIVYASPSASEIIKLPLQQIIGRDIASFYAPTYHREDFLNALHANHGQT
ncbi:MAG: PAS domain-containing protein [Gammaproteobacteria bacterium]|nr:PAS domain-containing protein [Gammaproteobacteria bacterium]MBD3776414.1 PAS domain-containing protein [Thiotrichales bacterium]